MDSPYTAPNQTPVGPPPKAGGRPRSLLRSLGSLRITVVLLSFSMALIFFATLDQVNLGIHFVQEKYFKSFFALAPLPFSNNQVLLLPLPGGYTIGALLLVNLVCAYLPKLKFAPRKMGVFLIHSGIILLILGQFFTGIMQEETQMRLDEGETGNYSENPRVSEFTVTDVTNPEAEVVTSIPTQLLKPGAVLKPDSLPFTIRVTQFFPNSRLGMQNQKPPGAPPTPEVNMGLGTNLAVWQMPRAVSENARDVPAVFIDILTPEGQSQGKWLVANYFDEAKDRAPIFAAPQQFRYGDRTYRLDLRRKREYKPFQLTLLDFTHERYAGTDIPKNFSSRVRLIDQAQGEDRQVLIFMNNPLRYGGFTFYQAGFDNNDTTTVLQVVQNPFWLTPYLACLLVTVGMFAQFSTHLIGFINKRQRKSTSQGRAMSPAAIPVPERDPAPASAH